jgi:hypothetical protein
MTMQHSLAYRLTLRRRHLSPTWALRLALLMATLVVLPACSTMTGPPAGLDQATTRPTDAGLYITMIEADQTPAPVGRLHTWTIRVTTPAGHPVEDAAITVDGDMPQHGHGLPTQPQVTRYLGEGRYLVEGMRFNMHGWWTLSFAISAERGADQVTFNLVL